jgi:hypothetical protein
MSQSSRQYVPSLGISLEYRTEDVPDDGKYHVLVDKEIVASYKSKAAATKRYKELIELAGGYPVSKVKMTEEEKRKLAIEADVNRVLDLAEQYWGSAGTRHKGSKYRG